MKIDERTGRKPYVGPQWEYRSRVMDLDADLAQYGQDGWELVSVVPIPHDPTQALYHFKRRRAQ